MESWQFQDAETERALPAMASLAFHLFSSNPALVLIIFPWVSGRWHHCQSNVKLECGPFRNGRCKPQRAGHDSNMSVWYTQSAGGPVLMCQPSMDLSHIDVYKKKKKSAAVSHRRWKTSVNMENFRSHYCVGASLRRNLFDWMEHDPTRTLNVTLCEQTQLLPCSAGAQ